MDAGVSGCGWTHFALLTSALVDLIRIVSGNHPVIGEMCGGGLNNCLESANTPHGRGHITGYVKHFCSFYADITGDNP